MNGVISGICFLTIINVSCCSSVPTSKQAIYTINGCKLEVLESHRDLDVIINKDLSWSDQYKHISGRAYKLLGLLRCTFGNPASITTQKTLYLSLVRSQLVYCSQLWRPYLIHIVQLERIQRRATRFIVNNSQLNYKERLEALHLLPLMMWFELHHSCNCTWPTSDHIWNTLHLYGTPTNGDLSAPWREFRNLHLRCALKTGVLDMSLCFSHATCLPLPAEDAI